MKFQIKFIAVDDNILDILALNISIKKSVFKIMAGEYGKINILLATTESVTKPSSTPSGSTNFEDEIKQGSVSLQNYPVKNYTSNSYKMGTPNA